MPFHKYIFTPRLLKEYDGSRDNYEPGTLEKYGDQLLTALNLMWSFSYYTSPILVSILYRRGYFVAESVGPFAKVTTGLGLLVAMSLCMRGLGRSMNTVYVRFAETLENARRSSDRCGAPKAALRRYDFDFEQWPVDYTVKGGSRKTVAQRNKNFWISSLPCQIAAYPMLIEGRTKLVTQCNGQRNKVKTADGNEIDTIVVDNRNKSANGKTLVICSEGNASFYEIGIMSTPLDLKYSVLGWNHPGFAGSSGRPYPDQDQNAIDAVLQFAIRELGFKPENIILYGWSIGGYSTLYAASQYPEVKGVVLDATFDDVLQLALPRMPEQISNIVKIAVRDYVNLNNTELIVRYNGPVLLIRRTEDEIICSEDANLGTNRGNFLLISMLKYRFPNILKPEQETYAKELLSKPVDFIKDVPEQYCMSLLMSYLNDNGNNGTSRSYPIEIGAEYTTEQRNSMVKFLIKKYLADFKSTHCTPLPEEFFQTPWEVPTETDYLLLFLFLLQQHLRPLVHVVAEDVAVRYQLVRVLRCVHLLVHLLLRPLQILLAGGLAQHLPMLGRALVVRVLPDRIAPERAAEDFDRIHHEPRPDLGQPAVLRQDLEVPVPDPVVQVGEGDHAIDERLALGVVVRHAEDLHQQLLDQHQVRLLGEVLAEREQRPRAAQTVAGQLHLAHGVNVLDEKLHRRSDTRIGQPHVQIALAAPLEQHHLVAVLHLAHLVHHRQRLPAFHLRFGPMVRHQRSQVAHQVPVAMVDAAGTQHQHALF
uniref:AB hydrolase-1 domain-containing protein n=1 Tax=Anopheles quadriannulatus TaxID=34691 RepID=A0A182XD14_ANOQN